MHNQLHLPLRDELIVDNFAGGGGASSGIEQAFGRPVDIAINHDRQAIAMHMANHPHTRHYCEDVFTVDPVQATGNQPVGLAWFSPDCKHFSKAKGGKPVEKKIRGLAWVVVKWAAAVKPRVIMLENVEEFQTWGPLLADGTPCPVSKGITFRRWLKELKKLGYQVEYKELRACDYGAPTIRKRLFVIARRDGLPIMWPQPTHGDPGSDAVKAGKLLPWRTAAECIDWTLPAPSIFERKRPLVPNTLNRIARGVMRYVVDNPDPFIIDDKAAFLTEHANGSQQRNFAADEPLRTQCAQVKGGHFALVQAFLAKHYGGGYTGPGVNLKQPTGTITTVDHHALVAAHLLNMHGSTRRDRDLRQPAPTQTAGGNHAALVAALLAPYYGSGSGETGRSLTEPAPTVTSKDRLQLVTVTIDGESYVLTDIGMRMLVPRELYRAQGFDDDYIIDITLDGKPLSKAAQVRMCGNSVCPPVATALVQANFAHELVYKNVEAMQ